MRRRFARRRLVRRRLTVFPLLVRRRLVRENAPCQKPEGKARAPVSWRLAAPLGEFAASRVLYSLRLASSCLAISMRTSNLAKLPWSTARVDKSSGQMGGLFAVGEIRRLGRSIGSMVRMRTRVQSDAATIGVLLAELAPVVELVLFTSVLLLVDDAELFRLGEAGPCVQRGRLRRFLVAPACCATAPSDCLP